MKTIRRSRRVIAVLIAAMTIQFNISNRANVLAQNVEPQAAPGDLDTSFGNGGKVTTSFPGFFEAFAYATALQPDGKIVVCGEVESDTANDFAVARYNTDGSLDTTFGTAGMVTTDFFGFREFASAVAIQTDGKILIGGSCKRSDGDESFDFALARYNSDGKLDSSFGSAGKLSLDIGGNAEEDLLNTILIQTDGRIVVVGGTESGCCAVGFHTGLARFNQNGTLDTSFGSGGKVISTLVNPHAAAFAAGGRILVAGEIGGTSDPATADFGLVRFNSDGSLDTNFGTAGAVRTDFFGHGDDAISVAGQADGKILLAGLARTADDSSHQDFGLARYSADGVPDTAFGSGGKLNTDFGGSEDRATSVVQSTDGRIVVGGLTKGPNSSQDFALAVYQPDGSLDTTFGDHGRVVTGFSNQSSDAISAIAITPDGRGIVAVGSTNVSFGLARYFAPGQPESLSLGFDQSTVVGDRGTKVPVILRITRAAGVTGNVTITPPDATTIGIAVKPPDPISTTGASVKFKLKIKGGAAVGPHQLTFTGRDDSGHSATATITVVIQ